jgi:hypothetical protein
MRVDGMSTGPLNNEERARADRLEADALTPPDVYWVEQIGEHEFLAGDQWTPRQMDWFRERDDSRAFVDWYLDRIA